MMSGFIGLLMVFSFSASALGADWFYRPMHENVGHNRQCRGEAFGEICDGKTYETAWRLSNFRLGIPGNGGAVDMSQMSPGDTLYVCGTHHRFNFDNRLKVDAPRIRVSGNCPGDPGTFVGSGLGVRPGANFVKVEHLTFLGYNEDGLMSGGAAMGISGADYVTFYKNHIDGYKTGINVGRIRSGEHKDDPAHGGTIIKNTILNTGQGIFIGNRSTLEPNNWLIAHNRIENVGKGDFGWTGRKRNIPFSEFPTSFRRESDSEAIGLQGGRNYYIYGNTIRNATFGLNLWACQNHTVKNIRIFNNRFININGGSENTPTTFAWPSHAIMRSCFRSVAGHDVQYITNNTIINAEGKGVRWVCGDNSRRCVVRSNMIAHTDGIQTLGSVKLKNNEIFDLDTTE